MGIVVQAAWSILGLAVMLVVAGCSRPPPFMPTAAYTAQATLAVGDRYRAARYVSRSVDRDFAITPEEPDTAPPEQRTAPPEQQKDEQREDAAPGRSGDSGEPATLASDSEFVKPYSTEWWEREREEMRRLRHRSIICRGC
jgi:hypothetical protein